MPLITRDTAKALSALGNAARWSKPRREKLAATLETVPESNRTPHARTIEKIESHLERLDEALSKVKEASDWRDLTTARMRLHDQWCDLTGTHKPGPSKPPRESTRRAQVVVLPMEESQPAPVIEPVKLCDPFSEV